MTALSSVAIGRAYERVVLARLSLLGLRLANTGGTFDQGVDLVGTWHPSPVVAPQPGDRVALRALLSGTAQRSAPAAVQCKATQAPVGVGTMREFQHAVAERFPAGTIAIVACSGGFAMRALVKEKEWALRTTLLLHISDTGSLLSAASLGGRRGECDDDDVSFIVNTIMRGGGAGE